MTHVDVIGEVYDSEVIDGDLYLHAQYGTYKVELTERGVDVLESAVDELPDP